MAMDMPYGLWVTRIGMRIDCCEGLCPEPIRRCVLWYMERMIPPTTPRWLDVVTISRSGIFGFLVCALASHFLKTEGRYWDWKVIRSTKLEGGCLGHVRLTEGQGQGRDFCGCTTHSPASISIWEDSFEFGFLDSDWDSDSDVDDDPK